MSLKTIVSPEFHFSVKSGRLQTSLGALSTFFPYYVSHFKTAVFTSDTCENWSIF